MVREERKHKSRHKSRRERDPEGAPKDDARRSEKARSEAQVCTESLPAPCASCPENLTARTLEERSYPAILIYFCSSV